MTTLKELSIAEIAIIEARILRGDKHSDITSDFRLNQGRISIFVRENLIAISNPPT